MFDWDWLAAQVRWLSAVRQQSSATQVRSQHTRRSAGSPGAWKIRERLTARRIPWRLELQAARALASSTPQAKRRFLALASFDFAWRAARDFFAEIISATLSQRSTTITTSCP